MQAAGQLGITGLRAEPVVDRVLDRVVSGIHVEWARFSLDHLEGGQMWRRQEFVHEP
jgi:hypothetical protein